MPQTSQPSAVGNCFKSSRLQQPAAAAWTSRVWAAGRSMASVQHHCSSSFYCDGLNAASSLRHQVPERGRRRLALLELRVLQTQKQTPTQARTRTWAQARRQPQRMGKPVTAPATRSSAATRTDGASDGARFCGGARRRADVICRSSTSSGGNGSRNVDPGEWEFSPQWWGTQGGGWGRGEGDTVFASASQCGNGSVVVTSHAVESEEGREMLQHIELRGAAVAGSRASAPAPAPAAAAAPPPAPSAAAATPKVTRMKALSHEWRVLRFNGTTRQSVARVTTLRAALAVAPHSEGLNSSGSISNSGSGNDGGARNNSSIVGGGGEEEYLLVERQQPNCLAFEYLKTMVSAGLTLLEAQRRWSRSRSRSNGGQQYEAVAARDSGLRVLCVGLGGGSLALFLVWLLPGSLVECVEIDPAVVDAAVCAMGFPSHSVQPSPPPTPSSPSPPWLSSPPSQSSSSISLARFPAPNPPGKSSKSSVGGQAVVEGEEVSAAARLAAVETLLWQDLLGKLRVYVDDAGAHVQRQADHWQGDQQQQQQKQQQQQQQHQQWQQESAVYDLVFVDAFDGDDDTPPVFFDESGPFLSSLSRLLHPTHGVVVVNLHGDAPQPSLWERVRGRYGPGWDARTSERGKFIERVSHAYMSSLLQPQTREASGVAVGNGVKEPLTAQSVARHDEQDKGSDEGVAVTLRTRAQGNIILAVARGPGATQLVAAADDGGEFYCGSSGGNRSRRGSAKNGSRSAAMMSKGQVEDGLRELLGKVADDAQSEEFERVPFPMAPRATRGLSLLKGPAPLQTTL